MPLFETHSFAPPITTKIYQCTVYASYLKHLNSLRYTRSASSPRTHATTGAFLIVYHVMGHLRCRPTPESHLKCVQVKSQPRCEACKTSLETSNSPCQFRDRERYVAERSRVVTGSSAGPSPAQNWRSSLSAEPSAVSPSWGNSVDASGWYWGAQASSDCGHSSPYASSSPLYSLSSSPQSNPEQWFSSPFMGSARAHYERWVCVRPSVRFNPPDAHAHSGEQLSFTSSLLQLGPGSLHGYDTSHDIADTSSSQWNCMLNHEISPSNSHQVNIPHLTMPVYRQNRPQSPNYSANDPKTLLIARPSSTFEVAPRSVQRGLDTPNVDPDDSINGPTVDAVLRLREGQCSPAERVNTIASTPPSPDAHEYSTNFHHRPTQYAITLESTSVLPHQQSPSPRPNTIAGHLSMSPSSPGSLSDVFTSVNLQQWRDLEIAESETSPGVPNSVETDLPSTTIQQDRTTVAEEPNFCHLCSISFTQPQVFRRHLKDKHEDKESCTHCSSFKWSRGRPHLYQRHLKVMHPEVTSSEDLPRRTRKLRTVARQRNRKSEATSGSVIPRPYCRCHDSISGPSIPSSCS
jgi:hypothetical protein